MPFSSREKEVEDWELRGSGRVTTEESMVRREACTQPQTVTHSGGVGGVGFRVLHSPFLLNLLELLLTVTKYRQTKNSLLVPANRLNAEELSVNHKSHQVHGQLFVALLPARHRAIMLGRLLRSGWLQQSLQPALRAQFATEASAGATSVPASDSQEQQQQRKERTPLPPDAVKLRLARLPNRWTLEQVRRLYQKIQGKATCSML